MYKAGASIVYSLDKLPIEVRAEAYNLDGFNSRTG
jgi:hypothetical protein